MDEIENLQFDINNRIEKARRNFKKSPKDRITPSYLEVRLQNLEELWVNFKNNHDKLIKFYSGKSLDTSKYCEDDVYDATEELFTVYKAELTAEVKAKQPQLQSHPSSAGECGNKIKSIKLPKIVIPTFSGKYTEWVTFRDLFESLIHNNTEIEDVQKLHYLKGYLSGEAEQLLRNIPISAANYSVCWNNLESRYNNKKYICNNILKTMLSQRSLTSESAYGLKELVNTTDDCLSGLKNIGVDITTWDVIVIHLISLKLDNETKKQWEVSFSSANCNELPTYTQFKEFLSNRFRALEFVDQRGNSSSSQQRFYRAQPINVSKSMHIAKTECQFCQQLHNLNACKKFLKENVESRRKFVFKSKNCFNCLASDHNVKSCRLVNQCKVCKKRHHTLVHPVVVAKSPSGTTGAGNVGESSSNEEVSPYKDTTPLVSCVSTRKVQNQVLLATALVSAVSSSGEGRVVRALLDQGSQVSFVTERTVQDLHLKKIPLIGEISGIGGVSGITSRAVVHMKIHSRLRPDVELSVKAFVLSSITSLLPSRRLKTLEWTASGDLPLADPEYYVPNKIDILLGAEVYCKVIQDGVKKSPNGSSVAQSTLFGWILSGGIEAPIQASTPLVTMHCTTDANDMLRRFWELEDGPEIKHKSSLSVEEELCEKLFLETTRREENGRYVVRLPFKSDDPDCKHGQSRLIAEKRYRGLEARFKKDSDFKTKYSEVLNEYLKLGHMIPVVESDCNKIEAVYLPHHAVIREDKDSTKLRVVFDASCKGTNGVSLNDDLMIGPTLQPELRHIITRWRVAPICLSADIIKMYRQVLVHQDDADYQRILWREDERSDLKEYKLTTLTFGTASAPYLAVRAMHQVAYDEGEQFPMAAERVLKDYYIDDLMTGCQSVQEGVAIYNQMNNLLGKAGFELQRWMSSSNEVLVKINESKTKTEQRDSLRLKMNDVIKFLGLAWKRSRDEYRYSVKMPDSLPQESLTKRRVVSNISKLFDPMGWVAPSVIIAKIIIQKLWLAGIQWDEEVPENLKTEWSKYENDLINLEKVRIPRWFGTRKDDTCVELHGFCDASQLAYAAVIYIRVVDSKGKLKVALVATKTKVAPVKQVSIPRLELCGAVLLTKLLLEMATVLNVHKSDLHAWTDSTVVLAWLNSHPSRWKVFVANRVSEIVTSLDPHQWSHVSTKHNPADCASRGLLPSELVSYPMWFNGPEFLASKNLEYKKPKDMCTDLEVSKSHFTATEKSFWEDFSSLNRLTRVIAYCRRFLDLKKPPPVNKKPNYLTCEELKKALNVCIKCCQAKYFTYEILAINKKENLPKGSPLKSLNPYLDEEGLLRVGGRLENSDLNMDKKHPFILPKKSHITDLIISEAHTRTLHGGPQIMLCFLSSRYFIIGVKQLVKAEVRKCVTCVKQSAVTTNQMMGQLPASRVTPNRAFKCSGVDYCGPIQIRTSKGRGHRSYKGYICLFICMATRAIHIEVVSDLTSQGFLQAFKRFVARRGHCQQLWSDNGTNFVGANSELIKVSKLPESLPNQGTSWHFIPPHSPNFGGLWEAGVKSTKYHLKRVIGTSTLTYEELSTVLAQVEACLNSRPLSVLNSNPTEILTPGHFLIGEPLLTVPDFNYESQNVSSLRRWQYCQRILQQFWRQWSRQYLNQFLHRYHWSSQPGQPAIDDVVIIKEDGLPPCRWLLGRIEELHPGLMV